MLALELIVPTFDFRQAVEFWAASDHRLAALLYFVVGGTPAYRTEYLRGAAPADLAHFGEWVVRFYHAIMRPNWTQLERVRPGRTERIWAASRDTFFSKVAGPIFERMCRLWAEDMADPQTFGGQPARVLSGVVRDPATRASHEVDVAALDAEGRVLAIGEVKWGKHMDVGHLARLEKIAEVLGSRGQRPRVLALFSGTGFSSELAEAAASSHGRIQLIDLGRLYTGS